MHFGSFCSPVFAAFLTDAKTIGRPGQRHHHNCFLDHGKPHCCQNLQSDLTVWYPVPHCAFPEDQGSLQTLKRRD